MSTPLSLTNDEALRLRCLELAIQAGAGCGSHEIAAAFQRYVTGEPGAEELLSRVRHMVGTADVS